MKAMIFAAGLGTRLKPLTDHTPKALIPVAGKPMLAHVIQKLKASGFTEIVINIHHLGEQICNYLDANQNFGVKILISDERNLLLDTGGGIKHASALFADNEPFLAHNVDILSNANLTNLYQEHVRKLHDATLLVSQRNTKRYLLFNQQQRLCGWINKETQQTKPAGFVYHSDVYQPYAFSGIQMLSPSIFKVMENYPDKFPIMDFYLDNCNTMDFTGCVAEDLKLIDIGKPETLTQAEQFIESL